MKTPISADNPVTTGSDNPATEPVSTVNGTSTTDGQAQGGAPDADLFKGIDPRTLPPQAKAAYDSMLKDYRDKTSRLSETIKTEKEKAIEAYRQKAEYYDQFSTQDEFVKQWNDYVQKQQAGTNESGDPVSELKTQLQEMQHKIQISELSQVTDAFVEAVDDKGQKLHPDFDKLNSIMLGTINEGGRQQPFSLLRAAVELDKSQDPQEKLANGYKAAKAQYDAIFEAGRKAGMGRMQSKVLNGTNPPSGSNGETLSLTEKRPKSAKEALEMAKKGLMVSRE